MSAYQMMVYYDLLEQSGRSPLNEKDQRRLNYLAREVQKEEENSQPSQAYGGDMVDVF